MPPSCPGGRHGVNPCRGAFLFLPAVLESPRLPPLGSRGPFRSSLSPDRGPPSGGGPPVGDGALHLTVVPLMKGGERERTGKKKPRLRPANPAKVNTTWEDQCKLAQVLRQMGVSCKACWQGPFCHKSHESGIYIYIYPTTTSTKSPPGVTSTGRTCDLRRG